MMKREGDRSIGLIDITLPLEKTLPTWPGSRGFTLLRYKALSSGDNCNNSMLTCDLHIGTHVDAPFHFVEKGVTVDCLSLDILLGEAVVAYLPERKNVTGHDLERLSLPDDIERLLLRTSNSELWKENVKRFKEDFVALTPDAAQWIVDKSIRLIGVDYLSVQPFGSDPQVHRILLEANVIILEGLNLSDVPGGKYELICLPLPIVGAEGAPARSVLRPQRG